MPSISFDDVSYAYVDHNEAFLALEHIDLKIADGEFVCLVGHSGCGKSTMLNLLAGLARPTQGRVSIDGLPVEGPGPDRSIVFQSYSLFPWQTALGNVMFSFRQTNKGASREEARQRATELLAQVGIEAAANRYPFQLSGGMRQRVAIARALAVDAPVMLLDEPFGALDPMIRRKLQELLQDAWLLTSQALLLQAGKPEDGTLPEEAELLSRSLSSRRLEGLSALLRQYSAECAYNVGAGHVLGALCAQWERLLHATR